MQPGGLGFMCPALAALRGSQFLKTLRCVRRLGEEQLAQALSLRADACPACRASRLHSVSLAVGRGSALVYFSCCAVFHCASIPSLVHSPVNGHSDCLLCVSVQGRTSLHKMRALSCDNTICEGTSGSSGYSHEDVGFCTATQSPFLMFR